MMLNNNDQLTEDEVIGQITAGNIAMYEIIVRRFNPYLYKIGRSYGYSHEDTQDLMQESFINAYKNLNQFEGRSAFKTWITRIMLNNCYRKKNKLSYQNEVMNELRDNDKPMFSNESQYTKNVVRSHELRQIIEDALQRLPFNYRMVFSLREVNGMSVAETADLLQISEANVKVRLNRAKKMLRDELETSYSKVELFEFNLIYCDPMVEHVMKEIRKL